MTDVPTTTVSDVSGMLAVVPTLVGFQPSRAIVILFLFAVGNLLNAGFEQIFTQRLQCNGFVLDREPEQQISFQLG